MVCGRYDDQSIYGPKFLGRPFFTRGSLKFENWLGSTDTFKMAADHRKMPCGNFFQNAVTPKIMVGIAPYYGQRRTLGAPSISYFDLGVTSRDLSLTLTVFKKW